MKKNKDFKIAIVLSTFDDTISNNLLEGARNKFMDLGGNAKNLIIISVPGAFEIPGAVNQILRKQKDIQAIVALGCVIKGETAHFEYISSAVTDSISLISSRADIPIIYGILTTYNYYQAIERSDITKKNKGGEVMDAAFKTILAYNKITK
tara:strand:+ start:1626 stop:2078 length:453 start_codon:yes stop_codon:yes gene_type:complete